MYWRLRLAVPLFLLMVGCAGPMERPWEEPDWQSHKDRLALLENWEMDGKLALRTSDRAESANVHWEQRDGHSYLLLSGPLGSHATTIESDGRIMEVRQGDEHKRWDLSRANDARDGWDLPLQALPYWLKGVPAPGPEVEALQLEPNSQLLQNLQQDGWEVSYDQYDMFGEFMLPTRVAIERGETRARLIIRKWQTQP